MPLSIHRQFSGREVIAAMRIRQESFAAVCRPLDGTPHALTCPDQRGLFGVQINLGTKTAADVGRNHAHFRLGESQHERAHQETLDVRVLVRDVQGVALVVLGVLRIGRTRLHRVGHQPIIGKAQLGDFRGMGKCRINGSLVTMAPVITGVVGHLVMDQRRVALGMGEINHGGQDFVIHIDQLGGVLG